MKKIKNQVNEHRSFKQNFSYFGKAEFVAKFCECMWDGEGEELDVGVKAFLKGSDIMDGVDVNFVYKAPKEINQTMVKKLRNSEQG